MAVTKIGTRAAKKARKACEQHAHEVNSLMPIRRFSTISHELESVDQRAGAAGGWPHTSGASTLYVAWKIPFARGTADFNIRLSYADARRLATALLKFADASEELEAIGKNG